MVEVVVLGSGSRGNATLVRDARTALLIDAGLTAKQVTDRLAAVGQDPRRLAAILLTHEHEDHVRGVSVLARRHRIPVFGTAGTLAAAAGKLGGTTCHTFAAGEAFDIDSVRVTPFSVPHDAADPVGFDLCAEGMRVGYATDLGHVTRLVAARLAGCQALIFEANHDREMLVNGPYPWPTKQRVAGSHGHLSNEHAASALPEILGTAEVQLVLAHLSETNNRPAIARLSVETALRSAGLAAVTVQVAEQDRPAGPMRL